MDYRALGLKVGLEIHQQLATHKLFCQCASALVDDPGGLRLRRRLRPTQSELGEVDAAAIEEARRRLTFVYEATPNSCLVEADEEPPHPPNPEALGIALEVALLLDAKPVQEVHFMRKIVIDGSNTAGFQRSALIALDGHLDVGVKRIGVPTILLEEDAARKMGEAEGEVAYRLDRLGIPLIEIATTPNIETPDEARDIAAVLRDSSSKVIRAALGKEGKVLAWRLLGFAGLLKGRLGPEFAAHARVSGVPGIFHSDQLPAYGITASEVEAVRAALDAGPPDAFVLVAAEEKRAQAA